MGGERTGEPMVLGWTADDCEGVRRGSNAPKELVEDECKDCGTKETNVSHGEG